MLKIRYKDNQLPAFWVMEKTFSIGRAKSNHLCLEDEAVDEVHARIFHKGESFLIQDADSKNGIYVNQQATKQASIGCGDQIQIGSTVLEVVDPLHEENQRSVWSLIANSSWLSGHEFPLTFNEDKNEITLGRSSQCDVVIPGTHLSRQHASIRQQEGELIIRDLDSANGTLVNNKKVQSSLLRAGDNIKLDVYSFKVFGPGITLPRAATQSLKAITPEMAGQANTETKEKLWKTRSTSPGNRTNENLYKRKWLPLTFALILVATGIAGIAFLLAT